jgi:phosphoribosylaminoimidazolecarboxamide formyltransferase/IMP cyclohydrolase
MRLIRGGLLLQDADDLPDDHSTWEVVSSRTPTEAEMGDLSFAWEACRHVKSNAIVLAKDGAVVGVGSGQPNRVESVHIAVKRAGDEAAGSVLAGDAFFPFPDGVEAALAAGVTAIVQPGGSVRDAEIIAAVERAGAAMIFTGVRHFRH